MERRRYSPVNILAAPAVPASPAHSGTERPPQPAARGFRALLPPRRPRAPALDRRDGTSLEIHDLAGRRVASAPLVDDAGGRATEIPGSVTRGWGSGVYFARVRDRETIPARLVVLR